MGINYGYVRVSTKQQKIDRQLTAMESCGIVSKNIYIDKMSGKDFNRPKYLKLLRKLKENDVLYIKSIDRLGRNYTEIIEQWNFLVNKKRVDIVVLDFPLLDTRDKIEGITGKFLSDIILQILSYIAQVEKENTHQRQKEGIREAQKKGIKFGRPKIEIPDNFHEVYSLWKEQEISLRKAGKILGISHHTFKRLVLATENKSLLK